MENTIGSAVIEILCFRQKLSQINREREREGERGKREGWNNPSVNV